MDMLLAMIDDDQLHRMADDLRRVPGVVAVALGGSRARGTHRPDSDVDLGVYYDGELDRGALRRLAERWTGIPASVAGPGEWGEWVDSGAWLTVDGVAVDWILRDLRRVSQQCDRAVRGEFAFHPQPGHPLGFLDVAYAGEVATCIPLSDDRAALAELADRVTPYPARLRASMLRNLWQADFLLRGAEKSASGGDVAYVALCATTAVMFIAHGWYAAAGQWVTNEKGLVTGVDRLPLDTSGFSASAAGAMRRLGSSPEELRGAIAALRALPRPDLADTSA